MTLQFEMIMAQRLTPTVCTHCRDGRNPIVFYEISGIYFQFRVSQKRCSTLMRILRNFADGSPPFSYLQNSHGRLTTDTKMGIIIRFAKMKFLINYRVHLSANFTSKFTKNFVFFAPMTAIITSVPPYNDNV